MRISLSLNPMSSCNSRTAIPSPGTNRMNINHITIDTSQGEEREPVEPWFVVRWGARCSNSLSNSIVKATSACDRSVGSGSRPFLLAMIERQVPFPQRRRTTSSITSFLLWYGRRDLGFLRLFAQVCLPYNEGF